MDQFADEEDAADERDTRHFFLLIPLGCLLIISGIGYLGYSLWHLFFGP